MQHRWLGARPGTSCSCFNPHPVVGPDATSPKVGSVTGTEVSILTRSSDRMQRSRDGMFQSSPGRLTGCNASHPRFQSSPGRLTGCNSPAGAFVAAVAPIMVFQSSPGRLTGCNVGTRRVATHRNEFQSSPGRLTGCSMGPGRSSSNSEFQSSPGRLTGCNPSPAQSLPSRAMFQSSPGRLTGCNSRDQSVALLHSSGAGRVSILTRSSDRMQLPFVSWPRRGALTHVSILTRSSDRMQARVFPHPVVSRLCAMRDLDVSILTRSSDRMQPMNAPVTRLPDHLDCFNPHPVV